MVPITVRSTTRDKLSEYPTLKIKASINPSKTPCFGRDWYKAKAISEHPQPSGPRENLSL